MLNRLGHQPYDEGIARLASAMVNVSELARSQKSPGFSCGEYVNIMWAYLCVISNLWRDRHGI